MLCFRILITCSRRTLSLIFTTLLLVGCASIDFDYPKSETTAFSDTSDTQLGRFTATGVDRNPGKAGFYPLVDGIDALGARLILADRAERSIDAQYFLITDDLVGHLFLESLLRAADRGVRVRLLIDDIHTKGADPGLAALNAHENVEVRLYNPFAHRTVRALNAPSFGRVIRRMHNKSFTVDNQMTVLGGRNIADEYFDGSQEEKFRGLDVLAIGPLANDVSVMFDNYWNHKAAVPIYALASQPDAPDAALRELFTKVTMSRAEVDETRYRDAVDHSIRKIIHEDLTAYIWAPYEFVFDSPDKTFSETSANFQTIVKPVQNTTRHAKQELLVLSPYVVMRNREIEEFRRMRERGVEIAIITNSLASNNHTVSHSGYAPIRKPLIEMGVQLYEFKANTSVPGDSRVGVQSAKSTLHAKAFVVDRQKLFIGSFNWNQRSENVDTEMGVIIDSDILAEDFANRIVNIGRDHSFEVATDDAGRILWKSRENGDEITILKEPQTSAWQRFVAAFLSKLPIKGEL